MESLSSNTVACVSFLILPALSHKANRISNSWWGIGFPDKSVPGVRDNKVLKVSGTASTKCSGLAGAFLAAICASFSKAFTRIVPLSSLFTYIMRNLS